MINTNMIRSAVKTGDTRRLEEMLLQGLNLNSPLKQDWTLLHLAAKAGQASMVSFLLDHGAKVDPQTERERACSAEYRIMTTFPARQA